MKKVTLIPIAVLFILLTLSITMNVHQFRQVGETVSDTLRVTIVDTIPYFKPIPRDSLVIRYITETLPAVNDEETESVAAESKTDSVNVVIPISQKVYQDSTYTAYVSGYLPNLDSIFVFPRYEVITVTNTTYQKPKRWGIGIQGGVGVTGKGLSPYIGVGVSYQLWQW